MKFEEAMTNLRNDLKALIKADSEAKWIEQITAIDKKADDIVAAHKATADELQETKNSFVDYVKNYGFKNKSGEDESEPPQNKSLDDIMSEELKQFKEKEK